MIQLVESNSQVVLKTKGYIRKINGSVKDEKTNAFTAIELTHTKHSMKRTQQRGISREAILLAVLYGTCIEKQNFVFHVVRDKDIPQNLDNCQKEALRNLVVVLDKLEETIITCYRSKNAIRNINRKTKYLLKAA